MGFYIMCPRINFFLLKRILELNFQEDYLTSLPKNDPFLAFGFLQTLNDERHSLRRLIELKFQLH